VVLEQTHPTLAQQGVVVSSLDRAAREHETELRPALGALLHDDYDWYAALGSTLRQGGAFVHVPKGVKASMPCGSSTGSTAPAASSLRAP